jgi:hypothetical protein
MEQKTKLPEPETEEYYQMMFESCHQMVEGLKGMIRISELNLMTNLTEKEMNHNIDQIKFFKDTLHFWNTTLINLQHHKTDVPRQLTPEQPNSNQTEVKKTKRKNWLALLFGR